MLNCRCSVSGTCGVEPAEWNLRSGAEKGAKGRKEGTNRCGTCGASGISPSYFRRFRVASPSVKYPVVPLGLREWDMPIRSFSLPKSRRDGIMPNCRCSVGGTCGTEKGAKGRKEGTNR